MWHTIYQTIDGRLHYDRAFKTWDEALEYLEREAEACLPTHRCVLLDPERGTLLTVYGGDDDVVTFIVADEDLRLYGLR